MGTLLANAAPVLRVAFVMEDTEDDDGVLHHSEHNDVWEALQVDLLLGAAPLRETSRVLTQEGEMLLDFIVELLTQPIALVLVPEIAIDEFVARAIPDFQTQAHAFFALRAISRTSSHV